MHDQKITKCYGRITYRKSLTSKNLLMAMFRSESIWYMAFEVAFRLSEGMEESIGKGQDVKIFMVQVKIAPLANVRIDFVEHLFKVEFAVKFILEEQLANWPDDRAPYIDYSLVSSLKAIRNKSCFKTNLTKLSIILFSKVIHDYYEFSQDSSWEGGAHLHGNKWKRSILTML